MFKLHLGLLLLLIGQFLQVSTQKPVFCYWGTWSYYRHGDGQFRVENIDGSLCTHLVYAFFGISLKGNIRNLDPTLDNQYHNIQKTIALKQKWPELKIIASIGGWKEDSSSFSFVSKDQKRRNTFASSALEFIKTYGFDGVDVDWEYPGRRGGDSQVDKDNFVLLMQALYKKLNPAGYVVTVATPASEDLVKTSYDLSKLHSFVDYILLMAYDFHSFQDKTTGHNAPLKASSTDNTDDKRKLNVKASVSYYLSQGVPGTKIILGIPLYGHTFKLSNSDSHEVAAPTNGGGSPGQFTNSSGSLGFNEICLRIKNDYTTVWDVSSQVPYAYSKDEWISFDDVKSVTLKARNALSLSLGGTMVWSIDLDDFTGSCGFGKYPLLSAIHSTINKKMKFYVLPMERNVLRDFLIHENVIE